LLCDCGIHCYCFGFGFVLFHLVLYIVLSSLCILIVVVLIIFRHHIITYHIISYNTIISYITIQYMVLRTFLCIPCFFAFLLFCFLLQFCNQSHNNNNNNMMGANGLMTLWHHQELSTFQKTKIYIYFFKLLFFCFFQRFRCLFKQLIFSPPKLNKITNKINSFIPSHK